MTSDRPVRIGISSCLLGETVRFDGGHKRHAFLVDRLGRHVEFVTVCPEVEALGACDLSCFILKRGSPSCGMERVRIYGEAGMPTRPGRGLFAAALLERFPELPVEEEGRLNDPALRTHFLERVFADRRLTAVFADPAWTVGNVVAFHTAHKLTLMAHAPGQAKELDHPASPGRHVNVLQHMVGYLKDDLDAAARADILGVIADYRAGLVALVVPVTLIRHFIRRLGIDYLAGQTYLEPGPKELGVLGPG
jgi:uncharacterized protein YbgA (DUF1722 family)/uncharacterized protein YbbK (DUF523 family)